MNMSTWWFINSIVLHYCIISWWRLIWTKVTTAQPRLLSPATGSIFSSQGKFQTLVRAWEPVSGHVYCNTGASVRVRRRLSVRDAVSSDHLMKLNTNTSMRMEPGLAASPALPLITCQPNSIDRASYEVPDTLILIKVTDHIWSTFHPWVTSTPFSKWKRKKLVII